MGEEKPDTLDFVKDFQEYLSQQTQHVNMISGSVSGVKEADELPAGNSFALNNRVDFRRLVWMHFIKVLFEENSCATDLNSHNMHLF